MKIEFDAEKHEYRVNGEKVPSVSDILSPLSAERYEGLNPAVLSAAAARGTAVHEATQMVDYGVEPDEEIPEIEPYMMDYQEFLFDHDVEWEMIEQKVGYYRYKDEQPLFCGTVDRYGKVDGEDAVVDLKTYASLTTDAMLSASCQTMLYKCAIFSEKELDGMAKRYILHLRKDGTYRLVDLDKFDLERGFTSGAVAWRLYDLYHDLAEARETRKKGKRK